MVGHLLQIVGAPILLPIPLIVPQDCWPRLTKDQTEYPLAFGDTLPPK